jgi:hypothetical protein
MEIADEDMGAVRQHVLPEGVPPDAEPITEDQLERLPEYVQRIITDFMSHRVPKTTRAELDAVRAMYFHSAPTPSLLPPTPAEETPCTDVAMSNSTTESNDMDEE